VGIALPESKTKPHRGANAGKWLSSGVRYLSARNRKPFGAGQPREPRDIKLSNVALGHAGRIAVEQVSGVIAAASLTAIVGPNGAGKSTLLKGLAGELRPLVGQIGFPPDARVAYLPQTLQIDLSFPITVGRVVAYGLAHGRSRASRHLDGIRIDQALADVGLADFSSRPLSALSGGEFQRTLFARLILQDASIVLLDEPFAGMDARTTEDLLNLLVRWRAAGRTVVAAVHDLEHVRGSFPETLLLAGKPIAWGETGEVLKPENLLHAQREAIAWLPARL